MNDDQTTVRELRQLVDHFVGQRDWHQFHTPKNLAISLSIEAAELLEHFQWIDDQESRAVAQDAARREAVGDELADVACYTLAMANELGIDLSQAIRDKMIKNARKYPADEYRGRWGAGDTRGASSGGGAS